jgi:hypothetical protein
VHDPANTKNIYRRGVARKMSKMAEEAIQDFEKVVTLDGEMQAECAKQIAECRQIMKEERRKSK